MTKYYGQNGEDFLLDQIFKNKKDGFYVEIGCLDGIEFSNTYYFEKQGWKGLCVEAHQDFIEQLKKNRKGAQIVHCAVGEKDIEQVTFYANKIGSLSTLDKQEEARWEKNYKEFFTGFEEQKVKMQTLTTIFNEQNVPQIDFVSLDIEGYEVKALSGLDLKKYRPRVFVIEYKDEDHKKGIEEILFPAGYKYLGQISCNIFYSIEANDADIIKKDYGKLNVIILDKDGNEQVNEVNLSQPSLSDKVKFKINKLKTRVANFFK
ncbi:MAG: FkbM family methyltransferase [Chitinophagaceae bacterium]|nr:FkbM family methyltransferase [Chitinophagaceae bacterium]